MANDYPGDTAPHPNDTANLSLSKINQLLYLLGSINGMNYPPDVAPHPNDTANLSLHKINRILKEGSFGGGGSGVAWGTITGDIDDQTDLQVQFDDTLAAAASFTAAAIAQAIAANDVMLFKGVINASGNPNYPAGDAGHTYRISVPGKIGGAAGVNVEAGDLAMCLVDGSAAGNQAAVGANWVVAQTNLDGAIIGPASSTTDHIPLFNGPTGKILKDGLAVASDLSSPDTTSVPTTQAVADAIAAIPAPSGLVVGKARFNPTGASIAELENSGVVLDVTYNSEGRYDVTFTVNQPDLLYGVKPICENGAAVYFSVSDKQVSGFQLRAFNSLGASTDSGKVQFDITG